MPPPDAPSSGDAGLLDGVRRACAEVVRRSRHVLLREKEIPSYAALLLRTEEKALQMDPSIHFLGRGEQTAAFFITLDAVNFGSGYFPEVFSDPHLSGYRRIAAALTSRFQCTGPFRASELARITPAECASLFSLDPSIPLARELSALYARAWNALGGFLLANFQGSFTDLIASARHSAEKLTTLLGALPLYRDVASYQELAVPFFKRAQISAADLHIAFGGEGLGRFDDIRSLTILADNLVPHVLRRDGVLAYDEELQERIDTGTLLPSGSPEEVEIRAAAVYAGELLAAEIVRCGRDVTPLWIDNKLWHRGQDPSYRAFARHRTLTPFY